MKFKKLYGLFRKSVKSGRIDGFVEHSFSMGWHSNHILIMDNKGVTYFYNKYISNHKDFVKPEDKGKFKYFIVRTSGQLLHVGKIVVDMKTPSKPDSRKYSSRNKIFTIIDSVVA